MKLLRLFIPAILCIAACNDHRVYNNALNDPLLYCKTVKALNNVVLENNFPPMIGSRNYVYANIAAYEVVAKFDPRFQSLAGQIKHLPPLPILDTANTNMQYAALLAFCKVGEAVTFPEGSLRDHVQKLDSIAKKNGMSSRMMVASKVLADSVAAHILRWSKGDNYAQTRSAPKYTVTTDEGRWAPTPPMYAQAVEPHWSTIRPISLDSASQFRPVPHPAFNIKDTTSEFYKAMMEVKMIGDSLTEEQRHIADFWDDNPFKMNVTGHVMYATKKFSPPGHWMNIVGIAAEKAKADFSTTVAAYTETAIALFDAFIICWEEKFRSNLVRPETVINAQKEFADWRPHIQTPPFPSYTSGHATSSAAAAEIMTKWFGNNLTFTDTSLLEFGIKSREIRNFRSAADEAAISRLYGGIHYRFDNDNGAASGRKLGEYISEKFQLKKNNSITSN